MAIDSCKHYWIANDGGRDIWVNHMGLVNLNFKKAYLPIDERVRSGRKRIDTWGTSVHWVGGMPGHTAMGIRNWWIENMNYSSGNLVIDSQGPLEVIPIDEEAYHSGTTKQYRKIVKEFGVPPYKHLVCIEFCHQEDNGDPGPVVEGHLIDTLADICRYYGHYPRHRIIRHYDITGKRCPRWYVDNPGAWILLLEKVEKVFIQREEFNHTHRLR
jgi:hypothetical protein